MYNGVEVGDLDYRKEKLQIKKGNIKPIYVCYGTEKQLEVEFIKTLSNQIIQPQQKDFAMMQYDLHEVSIQDVIEDAETLPFMVERKLIIANNASFLTGKDKSKIEHDLDRLAAYLASPAEFTVLILQQDAEKLDERKKIVKQLKKMDVLVPFLTMQARETEEWIKDKVKHYNCTIEPDAVNWLMLQVGQRLQQIQMELEKLSLYVGQQGVITKQHIEELVPKTTEHNIFLMIDDIVHLRIGKALGTFYELLKQREEPVKITVLIARQFRILLQVHELDKRGYSQQQIASQIGAHPYAVKLARDQARRFNEAQISVILSELAELDYKMKSGRIDKVAGIELFLLGLDKTKRT